MRIPMRAALRLALAGWLGLAGMSLVAAQSRAAAPPEKVLPDSTIAFLKINDAKALRESFRQSQFGQLWSDPGLKAWRSDLADRLDDAGKSLKKSLGVTYKELLELPQGAVSIAIIRRDDVKLPVAALITADAGKNASAMAEVLAKATKLGEERGDKVATESFKGATIHVIQTSKQEKKEQAKGKDEERPEPPVVWTQSMSTFVIGSDVDAVKDVVAHAEGRDDALAANENYVQSLKKLGSDAQVVWFVDVSKILKLIVQSNPAAKDNPAQAQQTQQIIQMAGLDQLKAAAGSFVLNSGNFDSVSKTFILAPGPAKGLLKIFRFPKVSLKPESWVPATVASYQSYSWDLDAAFTGINDFVNMLQPGMIDVLQQQLVGPNGGAPLSFQKDIFGPLGDRITLITDFKKPVKEDSQRMVMGIALEESKAFEGTLNKIIALTGGAPKTREFRGTTIYDFELPEMPNNPGGGDGRKLPSSVSVAITKNTLFVSYEPTLLEQILRSSPSGSTLAESTSFQAVAKEIPERVCSLSYVRPEEQARLSYDMVKSGQFEKALQGAAAAGGPDLSKISTILDKDKLPDFAIFAKYLSQGGGYWVQEEDGLTITSFTLRKGNP